jgi:hypothetical protein
MSSPTPPPMSSPTPPPMPEPMRMPGADVGAEYLPESGRMLPGNASAARLAAAKQAHLAGAQGRRISRAEWALVGTVVERQVRESLPQWFGKTNPYLDAGIRWLPLLLLQPAKRGSGLPGLVSDPRVISFVAMAGLVGGSQLLQKSEEQRKKEGKRELNIVRFPVELAPGNRFKLRTDATDENGLEWNSSDDNVLAIDKDGVVTGQAVGAATITVTRDGKSDLVSLRVRD